jgi:hypothetical protein
MRQYNAERQHVLSDFGVLNRSIGQFRRGRYSSIRLVRMSSSIASTSKASHTCRWICASEQRRRSGRGGKRRTCPPYSTRLRLPLLPFLPDQKTVAQHDQGRMAMEPMPQSSLILIPSQQLFGILMKALDLMPPMRILDQHFQPCRGWEVTPVIAPIAALPRQRSFADQPTDAPVALAGLTPRPHGVASGQPASRDSLLASGCSASASWRAQP